MGGRGDGSEGAAAARPRARMRETGTGGDARGGFGVEGRLLHGSGGGGDWIGYSGRGRAGRSENGNRSS
jgi:hypothetical protein